MGTIKPTESGAGFDYKEIYQQRYETYRHFDTLRWQMMQIGITAATIIFAFSSDGASQPEWWTWVGVGFVLIASAVAMLKINSGIQVNAKMLKLAANQLGDTEQPDISSKRKSVSFWIATTMLLIGIASLLLPVVFRSYS